VTALAVDDLDLPSEVSTSLRQFVESARSALGPDLVSIVLFGSAADGGLRPTSDVNLIIVLSRFDRARVDALRDPLRLAHATIRLATMMILESEIPAALEAFAVTFADIHERRRVLAGPDAFASLAPSREATLVGLRQLLLNFVLRMRERYALISLREEQLTTLVADAAGPLRAAASLILSLEGPPATSAKAALETLAQGIDATGWREPLANVSRAREEQALPHGAGPATVLYLIELAEALRARAERIR
jgi:hypothetical protein